MRFSSLVSLVVVTASFALGGCAADADPTSGEDTGQGESALVGSARAEERFQDKGTPAARSAEAARTRTEKLNGQAVAVGRTGKIVDRGASAELTQKTEMEVGQAAGIDKAARADMIEDLAVNPVELVEIEPSIGARLPGSQALSRSGEAHEQTNTSGAKREP
jgi:hypothetical protein